jgi:hypothetical protein
MTKPPKSPEQSAAGAVVPQSRSTSGIGGCSAHGRYAAMHRFIFYSCWLIWMAVVSAGCSGSKDYKSASDLSHQFETFFGFAPPSDVKEIKASRVWVGDTMADWISFRCSSDTFERVVKSDKYAITPIDQIASRWGWEAPYVVGLTPNSPKWWPKTQSPSETKLYNYFSPYTEGKMPAQGSDAYLWRDEKANVVFAYYTAWR